MNRIIIFDMDGVLVDSRDAHANAFNLSFNKNNLQTFPNTVIAKQFGPPARVIVRMLFPTLTQRKLEQVLIDKEEFLLEKTFRLAKPIAGVNQALATMKRNFKLALVTNSKRDEVFSLLKAGGVDARLFDLILAANDLPRPKPNPEAVAEVARLLKGVVKYIVGDQIEDMRMAKAAEVQAIGIDSGIEELGDLSSAGADVIIKSITLIPEVLR